MFAKIRSGLNDLLKPNVSHESLTATVSFETGQDTKYPVSGVKLFEVHVDFLRWLDEFLVSELQPSASYQRHITALKVLLSTDLALRTTKGVFETNGLMKTDNALTARGCSYEIRLVRLLLDLLLNPFDDIRSSAALLLSKTLTHLESTGVFLNHVIFPQINDDRISASTKPVLQIFQSFFTSAINRAKAMMSCTGRAHHADGFGHICRIYFVSHRLLNGTAGTGGRFSIVENLLSSLSENIKIAQSNLSFTIENSALHGNLIALRYFAWNSSARLGIAEF